MGINKMFTLLTPFISIKIVCISHCIILNRYTRDFVFVDA